MLKNWKSHEFTKNNPDENKQNTNNCNNKQNERKIFAVEQKPHRKKKYLKIFSLPLFVLARLLLLNMRMFEDVVSLIHVSVSLTVDIFDASLVWSSRKSVISFRSVFSLSQDKITLAQNEIRMIFAKIFGIEQKLKAEEKKISFHEHAKKLQQNKKAKVKRSETVKGICCDEFECLAWQRRCQVGGKKRNEMKKTSVDLHFIYCLSEISSQFLLNLQRTAQDRRHDYTSCFYKSSIEQR